MDLPTMRARVREAVKDLDVADYYWSDAEVDGAIERALGDYTRVLPTMASLTLDGDASNCRFDFLPPEGYLYVVAVEHPADADPPRWRKYYEMSPGSVVLYGDPPEAGTANIRVWYAKAHALDTWTVLPEDEGTVALGAVAYLLAAGARHAMARLNASRLTPRELRELARSQKLDFDLEINHLRGRTVGPRWWPCWAV